MWDYAKSLLKFGAPLDSDSVSNISHSIHSSHSSQEPTLSEIDAYFDNSTNTTRTASTVTPDRTMPKQSKKKKRTRQDYEEESSDSSSSSEDEYATQLQQQRTTKKSSGRKKQGGKRGGGIITSTEESLDDGSGDDADTGSFTLNRVSNSPDTELGSVSDETMKLRREIARLKREKQEEEAKKSRGGASRRRDCEIKDPKIRGLVKDMCAVIRRTIFRMVKFIGPEHELYSMEDGTVSNMILTALQFSAGDGEEEKKKIWDDVLCNILSRKFTQEKNRFLQSLRTQFVGM